MYAFHCDRDGCDSWQRVDAEHPVFVALVFPGDTMPAHFCCLDCVLHWAAAHSVPTEVVTEQ